MEPSNETADAPPAAGELSDGGQERRIRALYRLMEVHEVDSVAAGLSAADVEELSRQAGLLGYQLSKWFDGKTLVLSAREESGAGAGAFGEYELAALDLLVSVGREPGGLPQSGLGRCTIAQELIGSGWLIEQQGRVQLSKRTMVEKGGVLGEKCGLEVCGFCGIVNHEGNVPHQPCSRFIGQSGEPSGPEHNRAR